MKRLLLPLLLLSAGLSACVPAPLRAQRGAARQLSATLTDTPLKVDTGYYRRPGPPSLNVAVAAPQSAGQTEPEATYLYALLLPENAAGQVLSPTVQPSLKGQQASFPLPPVMGFTQLFVVGSPRPMTFSNLGRSVQSLSDAVNRATAGLPSGSWNATNLAYRVNDYGSLQIVSQPTDVNVYVNDQYRGITPITLKDVIAGQTSLRLSRNNYETVEVPLTLAPNATLGVRARLRPYFPEDDPRYFRRYPPSQIWIDELPR